MNTNTQPNWTTYPATLCGARDVCGEMVEVPNPLHLWQRVIRIAYGTARATLASPAVLGGRRLCDAVRADARLLEMAAKLHPAIRAVPSRCVSAAVKVSLRMLLEEGVAEKLPRGYRSTVVRPSGVSPTDSGDEIVIEQCSENRGGFIHTTVHRRVYTGDTPGTVQGCEK